MIGGRTILA